MLLTAVVLADKLRAAVPTTILSCSMVPFSTCALTLKTISPLLPKAFFRSIDNALYSSYLRMCLFVFENISAVEINFYGDVNDMLRKKESAVVISNHQSDVDWAAILMLAGRQSLSGHESGLVFTMKDTIRFSPLFGWYTFQRGYVYVRRFGKFIAQPVIRQLNYLKSLNSKFWIQIFPEGTRFLRHNAKLIASSQRFCEENNLPILEHTLAPKSKAFSMILENLSNNLECVYDVTLAYKFDKERTDEIKLAPNMFEFCCGRTPPELHIHIRRYSIESIPTSGPDQRQWLFDRFAEKDRMLERFYSTGSFPQPAIMKASKPLMRRFLPFLTFTAAISILPIMSRRVRLAYACTIGMSPLLILWLQATKAI